MLIIQVDGKPPVTIPSEVEAQERETPGAIDAYVAEVHAKAAPKPARRAKTDTDKE